METFILSLTTFTGLLSCVFSKDLLLCGFRESRTFSCLLADTLQPLPFCSMCHYFRGYTCENLLGEECPRYDRCEQTIKGRDGPHRGIAVIYSLPPFNISMCQQVLPIHVVTPGPVRSLKVEVINSTALSVHWRKPDDYDNREKVYMYKIVVDTGQDEQPPELMMDGSKVDSQTTVVRVPRAWKNASVTVSGKMKIGGFYGASVTTYISNRIPSVLVADGTSSQHVIYSVVSLSCLVLAGVVITSCYLKRRDICPKVPITLPRHETDTSHVSAKLLADGTREPVIPKRSSRQGSAPLQDSGHFSMDEDIPLAPPVSAEPASSLSHAPASNPEEGSHEQPSSNPEQVSASEQSNQRGDNSGQDDWLDGSALSCDRWVPASEMSDGRSHASNQNIGQDYDDPSIAILDECRLQENRYGEGCQASNDELITSQVPVGHGERVNFQDRTDDQMKPLDDSRVNHIVGDSLLTCGEGCRQDSHISEDDMTESEASYSKMDVSDSEDDDLPSRVLSPAASSDEVSISSYTGITLPESDNQV